MIKKVTTLVVGIAICVLSLVSIYRSCSAPVVLKSRSGEVCGCVTDEDMPTLSQCDAIDYDSIHEVITVSKCR